MTVRWQEKLLKFFFRAGACVLFLAVFPIFFPVSWMSEHHRLLGLGLFPETAITDYLTRSLSALYAIHGGVLWIVGGNLRRFRPLAVYVAWLNVVLGLVLLGIDLHAGMPWWWTAFEGPGLVSMGVVQILLLRGVPDGGAGA